MTRPLAILADDLTGACDAAAPFATVGKPTFVLWNTRSLPEQCSDVVSYCTESRNEDAEDARQKVQQAAWDLRPLGFDRYFKKIDSTLRGNWCVEISAALEALGLQVAVIAPAFPGMRRQIVDGQLMVAGVRQFDLPSMIVKLEAQTPFPVRHVSLAEVRAGANNLAGLIDDHSPNRMLFVVDSESDSDLAIVAEALELKETSALAVGSAGLATLIARRAANQEARDAIDGRKVIATRSLAHGQPCTPGTLVFVGSTHPAIVAQVRALAQSFDVNVLEYGVRCAEEVKSQVKEAITIVRVSWSDDSNAQMRDIIGACHGIEPINFILTGGDTAQHFCNCAEVRGIWIHGEIGAGLPWGRLSGGLVDNALVATKAGGFGDTEALVNIVQFLSGRLKSSGQGTGGRL